MKTENYSQALIDFLKKRSQTIVTAESLTGGKIASYLCDIAGASKVFLEGIVSYSSDSKKFRLNVLSSDLEKFSSVSEQVAYQMAKGAREGLDADYAISTTGVAGPDETDSDGNPRGLFFVGFASREFVEVRRFQTEGTREEIREEAALSAIAFALEKISDENINRVESKEAQ